MRLHIANVLVVFLSGVLSAGQTSGSGTAFAQIPPVIQFSSIATDENKTALSGTVNITFSLYNNLQGGTSLWSESQNVALDASGHYSVYLGLATSDGLPATLFTSGEAHWLGIRIAGQAEQPRVFLVSVPYAMKAGDAATVGGLPPSAFVLAAPPTANATNATGGSEAASVSPATSSDVTTTGGTVETIPLFTTATNVQNSLLTQTGTTVINVGGKLNLPNLGTATASAGFNSDPQDFVASVFNSSTAKAVPQTFQWQAEPLNNDKSTATGTLNLLYASGTATPAETGLKIGDNGQITFATGQTFPTVTGNETVTGDLTASGLISTVATGTAPLKVTSTTEVANLNASLLGGKAASAFAQLAAANTFTGTQIVNGSLGVTGTATISGIGLNSGGSGTTATSEISGNPSTDSGSGGLYLAASNAINVGHNTGLIFVGPTSGQWEQGPSTTGGPTNFMSIAMNSSTTAAQNISFNTPVGVPVQTGRYGGNFTNTLDDGNNNMTVLGRIWQKGRNYLQSNPSNPASTSSTSFKMMGLGSTLKLTPTFSGTVIIKLDSETKNTVDGNGVQFEIFYGTGTAPSNGSLTTGTQEGPTFERDFWGKNATVGFSTNLTITGLTVGTPYWFDIALKSLGSGSSDATMQNIEFYIEEI
jgi:hypothetical protein